MSTINPDPQNNPTPAPIVAGTGEVAAEHFLEQEVVAARRGLRRTQLFAGLCTLAILLYMTYLNTTLARTLEPKTAAEIARGLITERIETQADDIAAQVKERVPAMVADVPDYALKQMPIYREKLENEVEADLQQYLTKNATSLEGLVDDLLVKHQEEIKQVLTDGKDPAVVKALGDKMHEELMGRLAQLQVNGETLQSKIAQSLDALQKMQERMHRLATAKDLTPQETKARRAIAILTHTIESKRTQTPAVL